jgi:hypothetical protein
MHAVAEDTRYKSELCLALTMCTICISETVSLLLLLLENSKLQVLVDCETQSEQKLLCRCNTAHIYTRIYVNVHAHIHSATEVYFFSNGSSRYLAPHRAVIVMILLLVAKHTHKMLQQLLP